MTTLICRFVACGDHRHSFDRGWGYERDQNRVRLEGDPEKIWRTFQHWARRFDALGQRLTAAPGYLCDPARVVKDEQTARYLSLESDSWEEYQEKLQFELKRTGVRRVGRDWDHHFVSINKQGRLGR